MHKNNRAVTVPILHRKLDFYTAKEHFLIIPRHCIKLSKIISTNLRYLIQSHFFILEMNTFEHPLRVHSTLIFLNDHQMAYTK